MDRPASEPTAPATAAPLPSTSPGHAPTTGQSAPGASAAAGQDAAVGPGLVRLQDWGVIVAEGPDAATFLHGQLTQDITGLPTGQAGLAGYCSAKGRLLATFIVWRDSAERFYLACSSDLLAPTLKRLSMFVLRAKCRLHDASAAQPLWGLLETPADVLGGPLPAWSVRATGPHTLVGLPAVDGVARALVLQGMDAPLPAMAPPTASNRWAWLEVRSGLARVVAATVEQFVPQMVNLEAVGGVNFKKGCYPGQEVVARSQYRGTLKRRAQLFQTTGCPTPGQEVFHSADPSQPAGMVVLAAGAPDGGHAALVEVKLSALGDGDLHLGAVDGPVMRPDTLPYALPTET